jgi:hypothetical protein
MYLSSCPLSALAIDGLYKGASSKKIVSDFVKPMEASPDHPIETSQDFHVPRKMLKIPWCCHSQSSSFFCFVLFLFSLQGIVGFRMGLVTSKKVECDYSYSKIGAFVFHFLFFFFWQCWRLNPDYVSTCSSPA